MNEYLHLATLVIVAMAIVCGSYVLIACITNLVSMAKNAMHHRERERIDHERAAQIFLEKIQGDREHQLRIASLNADEAWRRINRSHITEDRAQPSVAPAPSNEDLRDRATIPASPFDSGDD